MHRALHALSVSAWLRSLLVAALTAFALAGVTERTANAEPGARSARERAALAYDAGVHAYEQKNDAVAARHFLDADAIAPNDDALRNALVAAKRSGDAALVRETAERVLARPHDDTALVSAAQSALTAPEEKPAGDVDSSRAPAPQPESTPGARTASSSDAPSAPAPKVHADRGATSRPWARPLFYTGVGLTAAMTGVTIWSGLDTLAARRRLPGTQADNDAVLARMHRTDALLLGTLLAAAGTLYVGIGWVDWGSGPRPIKMAAQLSPTRASLAVRGSF